MTLTAYFLDPFFLLPKSHTSKASARLMLLAVCERRASPSLIILLQGGCSTFCQRFSCALLSLRLRFPRTRSIEERNTRKEEEEERRSFVLWGDCLKRGGSKGLVGSGAGLQGGTTTKIRLLASLWLVLGWLGCAAAASLLLPK